MGKFGRKKSSKLAAMPDRVANETPKDRKEGANRAELGLDNRVPSSSARTDVDGPYASEVGELKSIMREQVPTIVLYACMLCVRGSGS